MRRDSRSGMAIARLLAVRVGMFVATSGTAIALVLVLLWLAPGDAIDVLPNGEELRPVLAREWGLDKPLLFRYFDYLFRVMGGDFGTSLTYHPGTPVLDILAVPALRSVLWALLALGLSLFVGTSAAALTAGRSSVLRRAIQLVSIAPLFLLAHLCIHGLNEAAWRALEAGLIDRPAWFALPDQPSALRTTLAIVLLATGSGALHDVHAELEEVIVRIRQSGFIDAARARGEALWPHIALNLLPPLASAATSRAAFFVGGLVILEKVLLLNGVGAILWQAALLRDYNLALGVTVVLALTVAAIRLVGDTLRALVDPRLRIESPR